MSVNRKDIFYTTGMMILITAITLAANVLILFPAFTTTVFRGQVQVKAISVSAAEQKPLFVSVEQKSEIVALLNESDILEHNPTTAQKNDPLFQTVSIHPFENGEIIHLELCGTVDEKMVLIVTEGDKLIHLMEKNPGALQKALTKVYAQSITR